MAHPTSTLTGLADAQVAELLAVHGQNRLPAPPKRSPWRDLASQFDDALIIVLLCAAVLSWAVSKELKTTVVIVVVVVANAFIGFAQGRRAERSLKALERLSTAVAKVRRNGQVVAIDSEGLVPGDVVLLEAGDRVPADGRVVTAHRLEAVEAALTGESAPTAKNAHDADTSALPIGDRDNTVFLGTLIASGRGEVVITATGPETELGRIATMLNRSPRRQSPLEDQLDRLGHTLAWIAGAVVVLVVLIGVARGEAVSELLGTAVALAVASIPEGLPAVTAVTLAVGVAEMARHGAIVKRLAAVETLGSTSVICTDKTGTLTLNEMVAVDVVIGDRHDHDRTGAGTQALIRAMVLANDASVSIGEDGTTDLVGDPTETALLALAITMGADPLALRRRFPRLAEIPFDSRHKFMVSINSDEAMPASALWVKGAPDVVFARCTHALDAHGATVEIADARNWFWERHDVLAARGRRVIALATGPAGPDHLVGSPTIEAVTDLTLIGLVGIIDPPRPEAREAIARAGRAGIEVKMITGDHAGTAVAIARELGLGGEAITGAEIDAMDDAELGRRVAATTVFARVSPEHKLRLVDALRERGEVVAMTGDGVNDAPALRRADIGVAMGITGTEVAKEAATMVLTDDNFATIVVAVERGRSIYANIVRFVRFQLSTALGFAATFLASSVVGLSSGKPFTAIQILWVNLIMDGPPAMALGVDPPDADAMTDPPRPRSVPILQPHRIAQVVVSAIVMMGSTMTVLVLAPGPEPTAGVASVAGTMAWTTFVASQFFNLLNARNEHRTVFRRATLRNRTLWLALGGVALLQVTAVQWRTAGDLFDAVPLTGWQWAAAVAAASAVLWIEELRKVVERWWTSGRTSPSSTARAGQLGSAEAAVR